MSRLREESTTLPQLLVRRLKDIFYSASPGRKVKSFMGKGVAIVLLDWARELSVPRPSRRRSRHLGREWPQLLQVIAGS